MNDYLLHFNKNEMTARHITSAIRIRNLLAQSNDIANIEGLLTDIIHYWVHLNKRHQSPIGFILTP